MKTGSKFFGFFFGFSFAMCWVGLCKRECQRCIHSDMWHAYIWNKRVVYAMRVMMMYADYDKLVVSPPAAPSPVYVNKYIKYANPSGGPISRCVNFHPGRSCMYLSISGHPTHGDVLKGRMGGMVQAEERD